MSAAEKGKHNLYAVFNGPEGKEGVLMMVMGVMVHLEGGQMMR